MIAIIKTGGKQYKVSLGDKIKVEKIDTKEGETVTFSEVLFLGDDNDVTIGTPMIKGASVKAKVLAQGRHDKLWGIKHKAKKRYKVKYGHKQPYTEVEITQIGS